MRVNKYYRCDESKLGNQRVQSHLGWAIHLQTEPRDALLAYPFLCTHWLPPINIRHFFLCCSERVREQKKGEGGEDKNQIGAEHNGGQCSAFSIPFYWDG